MLETKHKFWVKFLWCNWHHLNCMVLNRLAAEETFSMGGQTDRSRSERWWVNILPTISQLLFNKSQSGRTESHAIPWNCCKWANDWVPGRHTCSDLLFSWTDNFIFLWCLFIYTHFVYTIIIWYVLKTALHLSLISAIIISVPAVVMYCESRC